MRKIVITIMLCLFAATSAYARAESLADAKIYLSHGVAYERSGRLNDAISAYREAIKIYPRYHGAHQALGMALVKYGRQEEAVAELERARALDPNSWDILSDSEIDSDPLLTKPYDSAIIVCQQKISSDPAEMRTKIYLAQNYMLAERHLEK